MPTSENKKAYDIKYRKENQKRVEVNWLKKDFEERIYPGIQKTGKPVNTFIKEAVEEKLQRENIVLEEFDGI